MTGDPRGGDRGLGWGLVGASDIAASSIVPGVRAQRASRVVAVHSRSPQRGAAYAARHGIARSHPTLEALLADPGVEAVYVSTTNDRHAEEVVAAARAGRHVLCEKPLALTLADAERMVAACRSAGVVLATNHGRRSDPALLAARELVRSGAVGLPLSARTSTAVLLAGHLRGWRLTSAARGGGAALDLLVHDADALRFVLADEPVAVQAAASARGLASGSSGGGAGGGAGGGGGGGVDDTVAGVLETAGGLLASFLCTFTTPGGRSGLEVHGAEASLVARRGQPGEPPTLVRCSAAGDEVVLLQEATPPGVATVAAFEAAVRGEGAPLATGEDGTRSLAVALGALESARTGRRVVLGPPR
jgi:1,5-anhydro-D-fructose reductase (1,5-anhydro-D-mannitol-forming)